MDEQLLSKFEQAEAAKTAGNGERAMEIYHNLLTQPIEKHNDETIRIIEMSIVNLAELFAKVEKADELSQLIIFVRPFLDQISKAKAAKLVRQLVDIFLEMESKEHCLSALASNIEWAKSENRMYLKQALETRLIALYYDLGKYQDALQLTTQLMKEIKKLDDKQLLVEVQLLESRVYYVLGNLPRARGSLTSARTAANAIYCPPKLQGALDLQSGILHAADERDFKTAFSYFYESFEGYDSIDMRGKALLGLKYMLLAKIMLQQADEVSGIIQAKLALKYAGRDVDALKAIAQASSERSLHKFKDALEKYNDELMNDKVVESHLDSLYASMFEQNLLKLVEPYSRVQVEYVAKLINLPKPVIEKKLSQMILDKKISGILSQGDGVLSLFDQTKKDELYKSSLEIVEHLGGVLDKLYEKANKLS